MRVTAFPLFSSREHREGCDYRCHYYLYSPAGCPGEYPLLSIQEGQDFLWTVWEEGNVSTNFRFLNEHLG